MLEKFKNWALLESQRKRGEYLTYAIAFIDSSFFPITPLFLLAPLAFASEGRKWIRLALLTTLFSVLGGYLGYIIGYYFYELIGRPIIEFFNFSEEMARFQELFNTYAFWAIFLGAFVPIPYKVFTIGSGLFQTNLFVFTLASLLGRGIRFLVIAYLSKRFGPAALRILLTMPRIPLIIIFVGALILLTFIFRP